MEPLTARELLDHYRLCPPCGCGQSPCMCHRRLEPLPEWIGWHDPDPIVKYDGDSRPVRASDPRAGNRAQRRAAARELRRRR